MQSKNKRRRSPAVFHVLTRPVRALYPQRKAPQFQAVNQLLQQQAEAPAKFASIFSAFIWNTSDLVSTLSARAPASLMKQTSRERFLIGIRSVQFMSLCPLIPQRCGINLPSRKRCQKSDKRKPSFCLGWVLKVAWSWLTLLGLLSADERLQSAY
jgi:hypothetical protein